MKIRRALLEGAGIWEDYVKYTLDDFQDVSDGCETTKGIKDYLRNFRTDAAKTGKSLFLRGPYNSGKTMLAMIMAKHLLLEGFGVYVTDVGDMVDFCCRGWRNDQVSRDFEERVKNVDFLVIDGLGRELTNTAVKNVFEEVLSYRTKRCRPTVVTSLWEMDEVDKKFLQMILFRSDPMTASDPKLLAKKQKEFGTGLHYLLGRKFVEVECVYVDGMRGTHQDKLKGEK
jgi:DNA replication protein DnaC